MVGVTEQIEAVRRRVGRRADEGRELRLLTLEQDLPASPDDLWAAITTAKRLPRWFLPVTGDLRAGGRFQLEGNAAGTIERCDPGASFRSTWEFGDAIGWIEVAVAAGDDRGARLTLTHLSGLDDATWTEYGPGATGVGWDLSLLGLALHLAPGGADDPAEARAWAGEEDGGRFIELSGEAWYAADVVGGADWAEARTRADRTIAAYTAPVDDED
ncbi:SRPBCC domain-containing protein [Patulibacter sp. NPDC049589]|uniref:SRPBCC domain-containing protein n=1 Tax=Patulibacter sp. NPDC049589 TaxID=3154731 RepID=UPI003436922C